LVKLSIVDPSDRLAPELRLGNRENGEYGEDRERAADPQSEIPKATDAH
jgi:hypothetical protein